jgi:ketopantoate reductase
MWENKKITVVGVGGVGGYFGGYLGINETIWTQS